MSNRLLGLISIVAVLVIDQSSKTIALAAPALESGIELLPILNVVLVRNEGISFGLFGGFVPWWLLAAFGAAIVMALMVWLWRAHHMLLQFALGLIIGGALGNIVDRLRYGAVTDFLDFHVAGYHWPAFNFADAAIFCGVGVLLFDSFASSARTDMSLTDRNDSGQS